MAVSVFRQYLAQFSLLRLQLFFKRCLVNTAMFQRVSLCNLWEALSVKNILFFHILSICLNKTLTLLRMILVLRIFNLGSLQVWLNSTKCRIRKANCSKDLFCNIWWLSDEWQAFPTRFTRSSGFRTSKSHSSVFFWFLLKRVHKLDIRLNSRSEIIGCVKKRIGRCDSLEHGNVDQK
jgi:hypothetical protein